MSAFNQSLDDEVKQYRDSRVNAFSSLVAERAASIRYALDRVDKKHCDGIATDESELETGTPVEVKSVLVDHSGRTGRLSIHTGTHETLLETGGEYVIVLYAEVNVDGRRIVILDLDVVDPEYVDRWISPTASGYVQIRWDLLLNADIERERWEK